MRVIDTIPHPSITISIFSMNDKFVVKFEAGPMEQAFKFKHDEVKSIDNLKTIIDEKFISKVHERFNEMFISMNEAKSKKS